MCNVAKHKKEIFMAKNVKKNTVEKTDFKPVKPGLRKVIINGKETTVEITCKFDISGFDRDTILEWYRIINLGRRLDDKAALYLKMAKGWSYHAPFGGHDGIQLAIGLSFRQNKDFLFPYYRDMLTSLAAGITPEEIILNGLSKETDVAGGGRHMSNHFAKPSIRIQNVSSCTGNHALHAAGVARAIKKLGSDEVAICSNGESACSEGYYWEAINVATLEKLPVVFVIQNNKYGISVPLVDQTANQVVSENYKGMKDLLIINCDGRDPFDSYRAMQKAIEYAKSGAGPAMVHADCDRIGSHSNSDRHEAYRSEEELVTVRRRDPMLQLRTFIIESGIATEDEIVKIEEANKKEVFDAADKAEAAPNANGKSFDQFVLPEPFFKYELNVEDFIDTSSNQVSFLEAINLTLKEEFRRNPKTFLWGQDVSKGGVFNVVKGMPQEFGKERVFNAPIAEDCIVGTANGFCRFDKEARVVVEGAEFADYFWPAMEQLVECSHDYWRTKGQFSPNIVIRLASGGYIQGGLYHSQNLEAVFTTLPGIRVVCPSFADDAAGLLRNAIRSEGVTLFLEPKFLYNYKGAYAHFPNENYFVPFGKARIVKSGTSLTIVTYGNATHVTLNALKELEKNYISPEIIDLRSLAPWDKETVFKSVEKTGRALVVHEDKVFGGFGGEIASTISDEMFKFLDAPVRRIGSKNTPVGFAKSYENEILLSVKDVIDAATSLMKY